MQSPAMLRKCKYVFLTLPNYSLIAVANALEQDHVGPAFKRKMVKRRDAHRAATDHDDTCMSFH